jgi:hypothetical protein
MSLVPFIDLTSQLGLERLQRRIVLILKEEVNAMQDVVMAEYEDDDTEFYQAMDLVEFDPTVEPVVKFHTGHRPSLIKAPIGDYPNISVYAFSAAPVTSTDDHGTNFNVRISVEGMVKAIGGTEEDEFSRENQFAEELVNMRIQRLSDAILRVMKAHANDPDFDLGDTPTVNLGDVFVRREKDGAGSRWLWQGCRHDYIVSKFVGF